MLNQELLQVIQKLNKKELEALEKTLQFERYKSTEEIDFGLVSPELNEQSKRLKGIGLSGELKRLKEEMDEEEWNDIQSFTKRIIEQTKSSSKSETIKDYVEEVLDEKAIKRLEEIAPKDSYEYLPEEKLIVTAFDTQKNRSKRVILENGFDIPSRKLFVAHVNEERFVFKMRKPDYQKNKLFESLHIKPQDKEKFEKVVEQAKTQEHSYHSNHEYEI